MVLSEVMLISNNFIRNIVKYFLLLISKKIGVLSTSKIIATNICFSKKYSFITLDSHRNFRFG